MKRILTLALLVTACIMMAQAPKFRKIKIVNADFAIPSTKGVISWNSQSPAFAGDIEIITENGTRMLKITPKETAHSKKTKVLRAICMNGSPFRLAKGDTLKYDVEYKGEPGAQVGFVVFCNSRNHWLSFKVKCNGQWQKKTYTRKIKEDMPKSFFAVDVFHKGILLKPIKVSVLKAAK